MDHNHHLLRRVVHIIGLQLTLIYYFIPSTLFFSPYDKNYAMLVALICVFEFEYIRVAKNWQIPGLRPYEKYRFSAVFWSAIGLFICYLMCPYFVGIPVVVAAALVDPLMGELRRKHSRFSHLIGFIVYFLIFFVSLAFFSNLSSFHITVICLTTAVVGIVCETWKNHYLDDNFLLLTFPAITAMCLITFMF